jgi:hypothetical protein
MIDTPVTGQPFPHGAILAYRDGETVAVPHHGRGTVLAVADHIGNIGWETPNRLPGGDALTSFTSLLDVRPKTYENVADLPVVVVPGSRVDFGGLSLRALDDVSDNLTIGSRRVLIYDGALWQSKKIGADVLNDLEDTNVTAVPLRDQFLAFGGSIWQNSESFDGGSF